MVGIDVTWVPHGPDAFPAVEEVVRAHKAADPLRALVIVVPTNTVGVTLRRRLARMRWEDGRVGVAGLHLVTGSRLAELVATTAEATPRRLLPTTTAAIATAVRQVLTDPPASLAGVAGEAATQAALVDTHRRLSVLWADPGLGAELDTGRLPEPLAELTGAAPKVSRVEAATVQVHRRVRQLLAERGFRDETDLVRRAVAAIAAHPEAATRLGGIVVVFPQRPDPGTAALVRALAHRVPVRVVAATVGRPGADDGVVAAVEAMGGEIPAARSATVVHPALTVVSVTDPDEEIRELARRIVADVADPDPVPLERIAVVLGTHVPYARLLRDHFATAGIAWHGRAVVPLSSRRWGRVALALLALPDPAAPDDPGRGWERPGLIRLWEAAPLVWYQDRAGGSITAVPSDRWRRLAYEHRARRGHDWDARSSPSRTGAPAPTVAPGAETATADATADAAWAALSRWVETVRAHLASVARATTWKTATHAFIEAVDALVLPSRAGAEPGGGDVDGTEHRVELAAAERSAARIRSLAALDAFAEPPTWRTLTETITAVLDDDLAREGRAGAGVQVLALAEAVALDVDRVYLVGAAEEQLPPPAAPDPLLPAALIDDPRWGLDSPRQRAALAERAVAATLAGPAVPTVLWARSDLDQSIERHPPRWLPPTAIQDSVASFQAGVGQPRPATTTEERLAHLVEIAAHAGPSTAPVAVGASGLFSGDGPARRGWQAWAARASTRFTAYDGNLGALAAELGAAAADAFGAPRARPVAVTALERFASQPLAWFLTEVLGVARPAVDEELDADAQEVGRSIHRVLHRWAGPAGRALDAPEQERARLEAALEEELASLGQRRLLGAGVVARIRAEGLRADLHRFLVQWQALAEGEPARSLLASEWDLGTRGEPARIVLPDGRALLLTGRADRADRTASGIEVVDFKTGTNWLGWPRDAVACLGGGERIQSAVYALMLRDRITPTPATLTATWWYLGARGPDQGRCALEVGGPVEAAVVALLSDLDTAIAGGIFPERRSRFADRVLYPDGIGDASRDALVATKGADPAIPAALRATSEGTRR